MPHGFTGSRSTPQNRKEQAQGKEMGKLNRGCFKPGQSGNPGGRPKLFGEVGELAREHGPTAIVTLAKIMADEENKPAERIRAAEVLLDRGFGRPMQTLEHADVTPLEQEPPNLIKVMSELRRSSLGTGMLKILQDDGLLPRHEPSEESSEQSLRAAR